MIPGRPAVGAAALALAGLAAWPVAAAAAPAPDSAAMAQIQHDCDAAAQLRIETAHGIHEVRRLQVTAEGVTIRHPGRAALVTVGPVAGPERRIPWGDVVRIDSERTHAGRGALVLGSVALFAVGGAIARSGPDLSESGDNLNVVFGAFFVVGAAALGALIGVHQADLHRIYP